MRRPAPGSSRPARLTACRAARWGTSWPALLVGAVFLGLSAVPQAQARVRMFLGFGPPVWGPPAYYAPYYPPPVYYPPPPPVVFTPPEDQVGPSEAARSCDAGAYVCPLDHPLPVGATCWCRDNAGRRAYGRAR